ncbi:non-ribosomal peptide synthetase [Actinospica robiniae]|uniref:non-ribosomal peptide synthetase n=1 Tax=Actinospica robiniae TaxID=304901 RepID=UPI00041239C4|nr:non-ribosomal peptide synthetase [Actinospica robiniae]
MLERFREHAAARPDAVAATGGGCALTYRELASAARATARGLTAAGVRPGDRVAVLAERSALAAVALIAVWQAGAVYVPVDPDHPDERVRFLLSDCAARVVLTEPGLVARVPAGSAVLIEAGAASQAADGADPATPAPDEVAYIIYTSGSTGRPKGVEVTHRSLAHVIAELSLTLRADADQQWLTMAPTTFDISMAELCLPLSTGARVAVTTAAEARDAARLVRMIGELGVSRMQAVPAQWRALLDAGLRAPDLVAMVGGEALSVGLADELTSRISLLVNGYGPTETTIVSTLWPVVPGADEISLGRPIAGTRLYLLDDQLREVPVGEAGELYIAGAGVARGYLGRPDLTNAAFLDDPWGPAGSRMYRTGDRCRWNPDGALIYLGRGDGQVKVRGQRVETGEVENRLLLHPGIAGAAVVVRDDVLVAYVTPTAGDSAAGTGAAVLEAVAVRTFAAAALTPAMVPGLVVVLDAFPLTPNGKIDRSALSDLPVHQTTANDLTSGGEDTTEADDPFATAVCELIAEVLNVDFVRAGDDFFELGGSSFAVMRVAAAMADLWSVEVPTEVFYDAETVGDLAAAVDRLRAGAS